MESENGWSLCLLPLGNYSNRMRATLTLWTDDVVPISFLIGKNGSCFERNQITAVVNGSQGSDGSEMGDTLFENK
jgi:hypothetical protein